MTTDELTTPSERLKILCETYFGGNKSKMGKTLDVSYQNINNYLEKGKKPSFDVMQKAYATFYEKINPDWLFLGQGEMYKEGIVNPHASAATASSSSSATTAGGIGGSMITKQLFDYQSMIIELQQKVIRQLEK